ncbi:MAG TPA: oligopeptide ABC transporter permease OppB [Steroidobacteraceae bacterium]|nr:oligopeptide ABC transporter permease OppB [Steroidobacteraceae bacterium]
MLRYTLRRLIIAVPTLLLIATLAFALLHAAPGGPFDSDKRMLPAIQRAIEARYHLDEPLWRQYVRYLGELSRGDLGPSFQYRDTSVNQIIAQGLPVDATVGLAALALALLVGGAVGVSAALWHGTRWDHAPMALAAVGISVPVFVVAPLLILVFAVALHWLPPGDWVAGSPSHLVLPVVALALPYIGYVARLMRGSTLEVLASPFIRSARAKGLPSRLILWRHALRPALTPLVSYLGPAIAGLVTGSIVVESVFGLPGIGRFFITAALNRDYTLLVGITVLYGAFIILCNLLADLCYAWIDPRVRLR